MTAALRLIRHNTALERLLVAFLVMTLVEYGEWITLLVYAYKHGGASAAGAVALAQLIPSMLLAPLISARGAHAGPARLMALGYLACALTLAACGVGILVQAPPVLVYFSAVCFSVALGVGMPMHYALVPLVVRHPDDLTAANAATGWCKGAGALAGPLLAGLLIALQGPGLACVGLAGLSALTPLLALVQPLRADAAGEEGGGGLADLIAAARVIASRPNTRALMIYRAGAAAIEGAIDLLVVLLAIRILAVGSAAAGYLNASFGAGGLIGASLAVLLVGRHLAGPLVAATLLGAVALASLAAVSTVAAAVALLVVAGACRSLQSVSAQTLLQRSTPLDVIICAFALIESIRDAGLAFGSLAVPLLVAAGGTDAAFLGMAALGGLAIALTIRRVRIIDREASIPVVEMGLLRNLEIFSALPAAPLEALAAHATYETVPAGTAVVREGEQGERYYAIASGEVLVTQKGSELRRMGRGTGFGEIALLQTETRTATVTAAVDTTLLGIDREAFLTALNASARVREAAGRLAGRLIAYAPGR